MKLKVLELHDLVLSKLSRFAGKDREDITWLCERPEFDVGTFAHAMAMPGNYTTPTSVRDWIEIFAFGGRESASRKTWRAFRVMPHSNISRTAHADTSCREGRSHWGGLDCQCY